MYYRTVCSVMVATVHVGLFHTSHAGAGLFRVGLQVAEDLGGRTPCGGGTSSHVIMIICIRKLKAKKALVIY